MSAEAHLTKIAVLKGKKIRRIWDEQREVWFFSVIDVVEVLAGSSIPKRYWSDLKRKLVSEGSRVYEKIVHLKFMASDGKKYSSDAADTETMFKIIQSIPSPNAEPFKSGWRAWDMSAWKKRLTRSWPSSGPCGHISRKAIHLIG